MSILATHTYAFHNSRYFVSKRGEKMANELVEEADSCGTSGKLALIDGALATLHTQIIEKNWDDAFVVLEALTLFNEMEDYWPMYDDGRRVALTNKAYGASLVTVLRALKQQNRLDMSSFPSLETLLRETCQWGAAMKDISCKSDYDLVCKAIGMRLFQKPDTKSDEARLESWLASISPEERVAFEQRKQDAEEDEDEEDEDSGPWHSGGSVLDEDMESGDFDLPTVWTEYKTCLGRRELT
ncbi:hypothetical protein FB45DRAFT_740753 [Roridomyces roridus]|uniref:Uncharacterized protein n=1 Tax=Roridomyces roridus TaxID=1738132 RepID=A0AAD7C6W6_9AGAR|nr:hypothetical protein FB45DRAFT_740753 [Roridomyces roridus]